MREQAKGIGITFEVGQVVPEVCFTWRCRS